MLIINVFKSYVRAAFSLPHRKEAFNKQVLFT